MSSKVLIFNCLVNNSLSKSLHHFLFFLSLRIVNRFEKNPIEYGKNFFENKNQVLNSWNILRA